MAIELSHNECCNMIETVEYNIQYYRHFASEVAHKPVNTRNKMTFFCIYILQVWELVVNYVTKVSCVRHPINIVSIDLNGFTITIACAKHHSCSFLIIKCHMKFFPVLLTYIHHVLQTL